MKQQQNILKVLNEAFNDEISSINNVLHNTTSNINTFCQILNKLLTVKGKIVLTGIGKSGHIAKKISATLSSTGSPSFFIHPAEAMHGDLGMVSSQDIIIALSYSGEADELIAILPVFKKLNITIISLTSNDESTLAKYSDYVLNIKVPKEACPLNLAPTSSTTASLVLGDAIAICLLNLRKFNANDFAISHPGGQLGRRLLMRVSDIMRTNPQIPIVLINDNIKSVIMEISNKGLGFVAVLDLNNNLVGSITDGDLRRSLDRDINLNTTLAQEIMHLNPHTIMAQDLAVTAIELLEIHKITGLLVVDETKNLIGAFNLHDLFKAKLL